MHPNQPLTILKHSPLYWGEESAKVLNTFLDKHPKFFLLCDTHCQKMVLPKLYSLCPQTETATLIRIPAGEQHKNSKSLIHIWDCLFEQQATRNSLLLCVGGGMICDMGGFAASTWLRGIPFILIPTTLMAQVDAAIGGKNAINFKQAKNQAGLFSLPDATFLFPSFLKTLPLKELLSGFAEMLKHGLIADATYWHALQQCPSASEVLRFPEYICHSASIKSGIVAKDFRENGLRQQLNFGHTIGHALESFALHTLETAPSVRPPQLHGYFVAFGLICELYLSIIKTGFPSDKMHQTVRFIKEHYGKMVITCDDYPVLTELMTHDKKNVAGKINFTLLGGIGDIRINQNATKEEIYEALDFFREG